MSFEATVAALAERDTSHVDLEYFTAILRDVLAVAPAESLTQVIQTQIARSEGDTELERAE